MKLSIITPTCRENPRLMEASRTIAAALDRAPADMTVDWIIVDEKEREWHQLVDTAAINRARMDHGIIVQVTRPLPSKYREATEKAPAHNAAIGAGMLAADGDYVVILNDCNVVTYNMLNVIYDCAQQGVGFRARMHDVYDMPVPEDGKVAYKDHHDLLRPVPNKSATGPLWGAPMAAWQRIRGFDRSYDGEAYGHDLDAAIRLGRTGVRFVTTERAFVIQLRRTKTPQEITTRKDVVKGERNRKLINQLEREKTRLLPLWAADEDEPKPQEVARAAAVVEGDAPRPAWKKRAPPIVGGRNAPKHNAPRKQALRPEPRPAAAAPARVGDQPSQPAPLPPTPDTGIRSRATGLPPEKRPLEPDAVNAEPDLSNGVGRMGDETSLELDEIAEDLGLD